MSDWDAASSDEGGFAGGPAANAFSDEDGAGFSDEEEEDETLAEMAREKAEAEAKLKEGKPSKTFDEIMAERAAKDQAALLAEKRKEEADRDLTPAEQLQRMREGLKAAEEADNALTNELFGMEVSKEGSPEVEAAALEALTLAASKLVLLEDGDYDALSAALISKLRADGGEFVGDFLETLIGELTTTQLEAQLTPIGEMLSAAQSSAEAMEAAEAAATTTARAGDEGDAGLAGKKKGSSTAPAKAKLDDKKVGSVYSAFEGLGDDGGGDDDDDSDESSDENDDGDFM